MSISVECPECSKRLKAPERLAGHKVKCPKCRHSWLLPAPNGRAKPQMPIADESRAASVTAIRKGRSTLAKSAVDQPVADAKSPSKHKPPSDARPLPSKAKPSQPTDALKKPPTKSPSVRKAVVPPATPEQARTATAEPKKKETLEPPPKPIEQKIEPLCVTKQIHSTAPPVIEPQDERSTVAVVPESPSTPAVDIAPADGTVEHKAPVDSQEHSKADLRWSNAESTSSASTTEYAATADIAEPAAASPTDELPDGADWDLDIGDTAIEPKVSLPEITSLSSLKLPVGDAAAQGDSQAADRTGLDVAWFVQSYMGEQFGPLVKVELDDWVTQGRLTGDCHVFQEGWQEWREARSVYPELEFVTADDEEIELALAEADKADGAVSLSETAWYSVRMGLSLIGGSSIAAIATLVLLAVGFFADHVPLGQIYFDVMHDRTVDPDQGGGLVSMVLVSWGLIGLFMSLVALLVGTLVCMSVPRKTNLYPFAVGAVSATLLAAFVAVLAFTGVFLSLTPIAKMLHVGSAIRTLLGMTPWTFFLCWQGAMVAIAVFLAMLANFLGVVKVSRQLRWFGALQGGLLLWALLDAALIPDDSGVAFAIALFVFLTAVIASLIWLGNLARWTRDAIRPS